jgi:hypothetical protein
VSLDSPNTIDLIGTDNLTGSVHLTVVDTDDWSNENDHLKRLQDKLNAYLRFIESGEIEQSYPDSLGRHRRIDVFVQHSPTKRGLECITQAGKVIEGAGLSFNFQVGAPSVGGTIEPPTDQP